MTEENFAPPIHVPYVNKSLPQMILANRFDYTISNIKYLLPQGLPDKKAVCVMTAAYGQGEGNYDWVYPQDINPLKSIGLNFDLYDIADQSEEQVREKLKDVEILIVTGGDTYFLLKHMRACNFQSILEEKLNEGIIYLATSAGALVVGPNIDYIAPMDGPLKAGLDDFKGFGMIPFIIVPHLNHPHLAGAANMIMKNSVGSEDLVVGILDEQFIHVNQNVIRIF